MTRRRFSAKAKAAIVARQCAVCAACGQPAKRWEFDHIIALAIGGADEIENLRAVCPPCHAVKTKDDVKRAAKVKRIQRTQRGERSRSRKGRPLPSKPITQWRSMSGKIRKKDQ